MYVYGDDVVYKTYMKRKKCFLSLYIHTRHYEILDDYHFYKHDAFTFIICVAIFHRERRTRRHCSFHYCTHTRVG